MQKNLKKKFKQFNSYDEKEVKAATKVVNSGKLSGFIADSSGAFYGGKNVKKCEQAFQKYFNVKYAISVNSWTSGLICAVGALNIKPGDEIIVTPWTMTATATAIIVWGGVPIFSEIDHNTYCLDINKIEEKITKKTRAIISADIFGQSSDYNSLNKIAKKYKLKVISDSAQAIGSKYKKKYTGTSADIGGFSLNRHKHIQTGEGGIVITNNKKYAENIYKIRNHGEVINKDRNFRNLIGFNFRLGEIEAAISIEQLKKLKKILKKKQVLANYLTKNLQKLKYLKTPYIAKGNTHVYYCYPIQIEGGSIKKNKIFKALKKEGIPIEDKYENLMEYNIYTNKNIKKMFPWKISKRKNFYKKNSNVYKNVDILLKNKFLSIPFCSYDFTKNDILHISEGFKKVWKKLNLDK